jgi:aspartate 1-decarboxylase
MKNRLNNLLMLPFPAEGGAPLVAAVEAICSWEPALVAGPPAALESVARSIRNAGPVRRLRAVVSFGEPPGRGRREAIEEGFGVPLFDRYQMREFSAIAMECPEHRGLHIFADLVHVEVLREDGSPAAPGEAGEVVVTGLTGRYMPLIRYRTGDLAVRAGAPCPCGRGLPLLERIEGRRAPGPARKTALSATAGAAGAAGERLVVKSKIHKAHISAEAPDDVDCLRIDASLLELGDVAPCERVLIVNATSGARLETIALRAPRGSGTVSAGGAVARLCRHGDEISVMAFTWSDGSPRGFSNILVDRENRFARFLTEKAGEMI